MSFLAAFLEPAVERRFTSGPATHPSSPIDWLMGGAESYAGVPVTESNALTFSAVNCAVRILAESVAQLPLKLYRSRTDGGKDVANQESEYFLLHDQPNAETASFTFREAGETHLCTWGNFYAEIELGPRGETRALWQRLPFEVCPERRKSDGALVYRVTREDGTKPYVLDSSEMLHVPGLGFNGLMGFSPVRMAREAIGFGLALERYGSSLFANGTIPGLIIERPDKLTAEATERIRLGFERVHKGPSRAGKVMIADEGMKVQQVGLPSDDAEFLNSRQFSVQEIARFYNLPPHLLKDLSKSSFNNIEEQGLDFVRVSLLPWLRRWESELNRKVLTTRQREKGYFFEFSVDGFLRGNFEARMKGYQIAIDGGWLTPNQVLGFENINPDPALDYHRFPLNMAMLKRDGTVVVPAKAGEEKSDEVSPAADPAARALPAPATPPADPAATYERAVEREADELRAKARAIFAPLLEQAAQRAVTAEVQGIRRRVKGVVTEGDRDDFLTWLGGEFYPKHREFLRSVMGPVLLAYMRQIAGVAASAVIESTQAKREQLMVEHVTGRNLRDIEAQARAVGVGDVVAAVEEWAETWLKDGAKLIAESEAKRAEEFVA